MTNDKDAASMHGELVLQTEDVEVRMWDESLFHQPIESFIRTSRDNDRAVFLRGMHDGETSYLIVCIASTNAAAIQTAEVDIEFALSIPQTPALFRPHRRRRGWRDLARNLREAATNAGASQSKPEKPAPAQDSDEDSLA